MVLHGRRGLHVGKLLRHYVGRLWCGGRSVASRLPRRKLRKHTTCPAPEGHKSCKDDAIGPGHALVQSAEKYGGRLSREPVGSVLVDDDALGMHDDCILDFMRGLSRLYCGSITKQRCSSDAVENIRQLHSCHVHIFRDYVLWWMASTNSTSCGRRERVLCHTLPTLRCGRCVCGAPAYHSVVCSFYSARSLQRCWCGCPGASTTFRGAAGQVDPPLRRCRS
mmetsp:Transcript_44828/g.104680  ORF Transcript_44828/g.104680 Transcript_44828/m.104680 type:complete len:222 (+) Transcript_44828:735-1400(+)